MSTYKTQGIIIRRNNFGEASLLLHIYTRDYGKIEAVARSARKTNGKLKGHLEPFLHSELIFAHGKNIDKITGSLTVKSFLNLRRDLSCLFAAYYIIELTDKITEEKYKDEKIFYLLQKILLALDDVSLENKSEKKTEKLRLLAVLFQIHIANLSGFSPCLDKCVFCSDNLKEGENYFSFAAGGVLDKKCLFSDPQPVFINDNIIKLFRLFHFKAKTTEEYGKCLEKCIKTAGKLKINERIISNAVFLMNSFIEFNMERKIKSIDFLKQTNIIQEKGA